MRQRDANLTALAAIGPRKKRKVDSPGPGSGTEVRSAAALEGGQGPWEPLSAQLPGWGGRHTRLALAHLRVALPRGICVTFDAINPRWLVEDMLGAGRSVREEVCWPGRTACGGGAGAGRAASGVARASGAVRGTQACRKEGGPCSFLFVQFC